MNQTVHLGRVRATLTVDVDDLTPGQRQRFADELEKAMARVLAPEDARVIEGWTRTALEEALERLDKNHGVQARVIRAGLAGEGFVSRADVFLLGQYEEGRMLRGFTRPTTRIVKEMKENGRIAHEAASLLWPSYEEGGMADGFCVPISLASLMVP